MINQYCIIIDPYISPRRIADELHKHNIGVIALISNLPIEEEEKQKRQDLSLYDLVYEYNDQALVELKKLNILRVISGTDGSIQLADRLANELTPQFANDPATSLDRNDKYLMQEKLKENHLNAVSQIRISHKVLTQTEKDKLSSYQYPLFMKPINGLASFGAYRCNSLMEIETNLAKVIGTKAKLGSEVKEVTIQECLFGEEYFVDTISLEGHHRVVSVFRYKKINFNNIPIYRYMEIVDLNSKEARSATEYVLKVLDALGLKNGFGHTEIFLTEKGPYLIELNARISGAYGFPNQIALMAYGEDQAKVFVESIVNPTLFLKNLNKLPSLGCYGRGVLLQVWRDRTIKPINLEKLKSLASYKDYILLFAPGTKCHCPTSLFDLVCIVLLVDKDKVTVENDYEKIIQWEKDEILF